MTLSVLIPTRGRQDVLQQAVAQLLDTSELESTRLVLGFDNDESIGAAIWDQHKNPRIRISTEQREDTLGAKYNRLAAFVPADIYLLWADDMTILTRGWDRLVEEGASAFTDGMGFVFFGKIQGVLQPGIAATKGMVKAMGQLCDPTYAYWWQDTRLIEIGRMTSRIFDFGSEIDVRCLAEMKSNSRGVREIAWWGQFFDRTRGERRAIAERIIEAGDDQPFRKRELRRLLPSWERVFLQMNSKCSDPASAAELEKFYSFDAPADERYLRVKDRAQRMLEAFDAAARLAKEGRAA